MSDFNLDDLDGVIQDLLDSIEEPALVRKEAAAKESKDPVAANVATRPTDRDSGQSESSRPAQTVVGPQPQVARVVDIMAARPTASGQTVVRRTEAIVSNEAGVQAVETISASIPTQKQATVVAGNPIRPRGGFMDIVDQSGDVANANKKNNAAAKQSLIDGGFSSDHQRVDNVTVRNRQSIDIQSPKINTSPKTSSRPTVTPQTRQPLPAKRGAELSAATGSTLTLSQPKPSSEPIRPSELEKEAYQTPFLPDVKVDKKPLGEVNAGKSKENASDRPTDKHRAPSTVRRRAVVNGMHSNRSSKPRQDDFDIDEIFDDDESSVKSKNRQSKYNLAKILRVVRITLLLVALMSIGAVGWFLYTLIMNT